MSPRNTKTGSVLEAMVLPALTQGSYTYKVQQNIGTRPGGGRHLVDVLAEKDEQRYLVSLKWQQGGGTAEQKVPYEVICLIDAMSTGKFANAYLVLGGVGWTLRDFYMKGGLNKYLPGAGEIRILALDDFVARANRGRL